MQLEEPSSNSKSLSPITVDLLVLSVNFELISPQRLAKINSWILQRTLIEASPKFSTWLHYVLAYFDMSLFELSILLHIFSPPETYQFQIEEEDIDRMATSLRFTPDFQLLSKETQQLLFTFFVGVMFLQTFLTRSVQEKNQEIVRNFQKSICDFGEINCQTLAKISLVEINEIYRFLEGKDEINTGKKVESILRSLIHKGRK